MAFQIRKHGPRPIEAPPELVQVGDRIIGSSHWLGTDGRRRERFQVLTIRDGKIVDMQDCATRREAERLASRKRN